MSKIGKKAILIPANVEIKIEGNEALVKGPKGELKRNFPFNLLKIEIKENKIFISPREGKEEKPFKAIWGTTRSHLNNMIHGVSEGFEKKLEIQGVGYGGQLEGKDLILKVGFIKPVRLTIPEGLALKIEKNIITVAGIDKEKVTQFACKIRKVKKPDSYKGKGIRYLGEYIRLKLGKKAVTGAGGAK